ncbi:hypothetical protein ABET51_20715 [Metabacillus fastidiosus]|uniref:hypothetical protein n=1 Tax=Metabacillus fastidiosus TaxID=1458 RepID=UPI003D2DCD0A
MYCTTSNFIYVTLQSKLYHGMMLYCVKLALCHKQNHYYIEDTMGDLFWNKNGTIDPD